MFERWGFDKRTNTFHQCGCIYCKNCVMYDMEDEEPYSIKEILKHCIVDGCMVVRQVATYERLYNERNELLYI